MQLEVSAMTKSLKQERNQLAVDFILNLSIVALETAAMAGSFADINWRMFKFYTQDSNLLALIACAVLAVCDARALRQQKAVPLFAKVLKYTAVNCLAVTFLVVSCILSPMLYSVGQNGLQQMVFANFQSLFMHVICPLTAVASFLFFEPEPSMGKNVIRFALLPTLLYAAIALTLNITNLMHGPYPFLQVYNQSLYISILWVVTIFGGATLLAWMLWKGNQKHPAAQPVPSPLTTAEVSVNR